MSYGALSSCLDGSCCWWLSMQLASLRGSLRYNIPLTILNFSRIRFFLLTVSFLKLLFVCLFITFSVVCPCVNMYMWTCQAAHVEVRRQLLRVSSLLLPCGSQAWWQVPLLTEPSSQASVTSLPSIPLFLEIGSHYVVALAALKLTV